MKNVVYATLITGTVALALAFFLYSLPGPDAWPIAESPPRQGEALDSAAYASGQIVHSPKALARVVREPMNTWSNLAFVWVGALVLLRSRDLVPKQSGVALIAVGIGSFLYHASASRTLRQLDVGAMYWIYAALGLLAFGALSPGVMRIATRLRYWVIIILPVAAVLATVYRNVRVVGWKPLDLSLVTGISVGVTTLALVMLAWRAGSPRAWLKAGGTLALFGIAVALQIGDRPGGWACDPSAWIQAHSLWHILGALACGYSCLQLSRRWSEPTSPGVRTSNPGYHDSPAQKATPARFVAHL